MVFHGYAAYTLAATNLASDPATRTLNCIEFGASPLFSLVGRNQDELIGSRLDALYSADASDWLDFAAEQYSQINAARRSVQNSTMTDYQVLSNPVRVMTYDNGTEIYVNYSSSFNLWHKQKFERYEHKLFTVGTVSMQISFLNDKSRWAFTPADFALNFVKNNPEYVAIKTDLNPPMRTIYLLHNKYPKAGTRNIIFLFLDILYNILKNNDNIYITKIIIYFF